MGRKRGSGLIEFFRQLGGVFLFCIFFVTSAFCQTTYYVAPDGNDDANGLSLTMAFGTIQKSIDISADGDTVIVAEGTYIESIDFKGKAITVKGTRPEDWRTVEYTVIDGNDAERVVSFNTGEDANSILTGVTVSGGYFGVYCGSSANPTISHCVIQKNAKAVFAKGSPILNGNRIRDNIEGIICIEGAEPIIKNNFLYDSYYGVLCWDINDTPTITHNTVIENSLYGIGVFESGSYKPTVNHGLFWLNRDSLRDCNATYSCIQDANEASGTGNITVDPNFADANNFHILAVSPCIDAGNSGLTYDANAKDVDNDPRFFDGDANSSAVIDIGADEFATNEADFNNDGHVNFIDYAMLAKGYLAEANDPNFNSACDLNNDDEIDTDDMGLFTEQWLWQAGWTVPMKFRSEEEEQMSGQGMMMMESSMSLESAAFEGSPVMEMELEAVPVQTTEPVDVNTLVNWLEQLWQEDESIRNSMTQAQWDEFVEAVKSSAQE